MTSQPNTSESYRVSEFYLTLIGRGSNFTFFRTIAIIINIVIMFK